MAIDRILTGKKKYKKVFNRLIVYVEIIDGVGTKYVPATAADVSKLGIDLIGRPGAEFR